MNTSIKMLFVNCSAPVVGIDPDVAVVARPATFQRHAILVVRDTSTSAESQASHGIEKGMSRLLQLLKHNIMIRLPNPIRHGCSISTRPSMRGIIEQQNHE